MKMNKKGQVMSALGELGVGIAALAIILTVTFLVISEGESQTYDIADFCSGADGYQFNVSDSRCWNTTNAGADTAANLSYAWNATGQLALATDEIPGWVSLIVIAVIGSLLLGLVAMFRRR